MKLTRRRDLLLVGHDLGVLGKKTPAKVKGVIRFKEKHEVLAFVEYLVHTDLEAERSDANTTLEALLPIHFCKRVCPHLLLDFLHGWIHEDDQLEDG